MGDVAYYAVGVCKYFFVGEANDLKALFCQFASAKIITLLLVYVFMVASVYLNYQLLTKTNKVSYVVVYWVLATKMLAQLVT